MEAGSESERSHLRASTSAEPRYTRFDPPLTSIRRNRIRRFQCILCATVLSFILILLFVAVAYSGSSDSPTPEPPSNTTSDDAITTLLSATWPIQDVPINGGDVVVSGPDVANALEKGKAALADRDDLEANRPPMKRGGAAYKANRVVSTTAEADHLAREGFVEDRAMLAIKKILSSKTPLPENASSSVQLPEESKTEYCRQLQQPLACPETPYRSIDGKCNNIKRPRTWGVALTPFRRMLPPVYQDGIMQPRSDGLPSAREVSVTVHRPIYAEDPNFTVMLAVWGQFLDHDITATALSQGPNGTALSCCDVSQPPHPECFPVPLGAGDPYFDEYNVTCMEFVRSAPAPTCSLGPRQQMNQATSFIDGSVIYGPTKSLADDLREFKGGRLRMSFSPDGRELLPVSDDPNDGCNREEMNARGRYCFTSGDGRANENLHLTTMHLLWARHHNRLAGKLHELNPHWDDERLYQESRRVIAAQMQHITYSEFLPVILGKPLMSGIQMSPKDSGFSNDYDPELDPSICNSFAASAFRFAHTLLPSLLKVIENDTSSPGYVQLHDMLFDPYKLYSSKDTDASLRGAMRTNIERADSYFSAQVTQHLFEYSNKNKQPGCGLDLVSLNVQRGRDHGLPPYPQWRKHCGLSVPKNWDDLDGVIDKGALRRIESMYKSVDDIDVYTGSLSEIPQRRSLLGPTVTCMITDQFLRLRRGDRFWYETDQKPQAFTPEQLSEIRKTSLANIICDTSDGVRYSQPEVMRTARANNKEVPCSALPRANFNVWKEKLI